MKIRKNDTIEILQGKDKGKTGQVEKVFPKKNKILVAGINIVKKHVKPTKKMPQGGLVDWPLPFDISNAILICPKCNKKTRVAYKLINNKKVRICKKCKNTIGK
jgi:large subunit ribosomal protein L24